MLLNHVAIIQNFTYKYKGEGLQSKLEKTSMHCSITAGALHKMQA